MTSNISLASCFRESSKTSIIAFTARSLGSGYISISKGLLHSSLVTTRTKAQLISAPWLTEDEWIMSVLAKSKGAETDDGWGNGICREDHLSVSFLLPPPIRDFEALVTQSFGALLQPLWQSSSYEIEAVCSKPGGLIQTADTFDRPCVPFESSLQLNTAQIIHNWNRLFCTFYSGQTLNPTASQPYARP